MAFQVNIDDVKTLEDAVVIAVTFFDGKDKIKAQPIRLSPYSLDAFKAIIRTKLVELDGIHDGQTLPALGLFDPKVTPPTQSDTDRAAYALKIRTIRSMERAIALEIKTTGDQDYVDLKALIKTDFKDTYLDLV